MNFVAVRLVFLGLLCFAWTGRAQGLQVDIEEFKRLQGEVADLRDAKTADRRTISELSRKIEQLQRDLREANERTTLKLGDAVTREDLKKIVDRIVEVDEKRESDRKVILEEFEKLGRTLASASVSDRGSKRKESARESSRQENKEPEQIEGTFIEHIVKPGDTLGEILEDFNVFLKSEGRPSATLSQVKRANPKMNLDRIRVGQTILLPVPEKK